jgi:purine-nucleoside phosphorylase
MAFDVEAAAALMRERIPWEPEVFIVLGSGLGGLAESIPDGVSIAFRELPGFPSAGVEGHEGRYLAGTIEGRRVLMQAGRFHFYEGYAAGLVVAPVRIAAALGVRTAIFTNAAGGVNRALTPGAIMLIDDHLNLQGRNPLIGPVVPGEPRFPDMSVAYDAALRRLALDVAEREEIPLHRGVYAAVSGPSYETPAEIRMIERLGGDAVGMSTVPEVIAARARGVRVLGFSLITNAAAGIQADLLSHEEVLEAGRAASGTLQRLVRGVLRGME